MVDYQRALTRKTKTPFHEPKGSLPDRPLRAVGFTSGVGSMLIGADTAGFSVVGNIEWRDYYRDLDQEGRNTFIENFPGAYMARGLDDILDKGLLPYDIDLAMGHPECGSYSLLNSANKGAKAAKEDAGDIPLFLEYVAKFKPRFFVMDDLPQSFVALNIHQYHDMLPDYDLFPEWISNYNYGNPQKHRKRMFMIGSLKTEGYTFVPGELPEWSDWTVRTRISGIQEKWGSVPNHDEHTTEGRSSRFIHMRYRDDRPTWGEVQEYFKEHQRPRQNFQYHSKEGGMTTRPSLIRMAYDWPSPVLTGGNPMMHPEICLPISIRERARIQGFPDSFVFYGAKLEEDGRWEHNSKNIHMVKQTGKAMPIEFNEYVAKQIKGHIEGTPINSSGERFLKHDPMIDKAKSDYCEAVGYANQEGACQSCWLRETCSLPRKSNA